MRASVLSNMFLTGVSSNNDDPDGMIHGLRQCVTTCHRHSAFAYDSRAPKRQARHGLVLSVRCTGQGPARYSHAIRSYLIKLEFCSRETLS